MDRRKKVIPGARDKFVERTYLGSFTQEFLSGFAKLILSFEPGPLVNNYASHKGLSHLSRMMDGFRIGYNINLLG